MAPMERREIMSVLDVDSGGSATFERRASPTATHWRGSSAWSAGHGALAAHRVVMACPWSVGLLLRGEALRWPAATASSSHPATCSALSTRAATWTPCRCTPNKAICALQSGVVLDQRQWRPGRWPELIDALFLRASVRTRRWPCSSRSAG